LGSPDEVFSISRVIVVTRFVGLARLGTLVMKARLLKMATMRSTRMSFATKMSKTIVEAT